MRGAACQCGLFSSLLLFSFLSFTAAVSFDLTELRNKVAKIKVNPRGNLWATGKNLDQKLCGSLMWHRVTCFIHIHAFMYLLCCVFLSLEANSIFIWMYGPPPGHFMGKKSVMDPPLLPSTQAADALQAAVPVEQSALGELFQELLRVALREQVETRDGGSKNQVRFCLFTPAGRAEKVCSHHLDSCFRRRTCWWRF